MQSIQIKFLIYIVRKKSFILYKGNLEKAYIQEKKLKSKLLKSSGGGEHLLSRGGAYSRDFTVTLNNKIYIIDFF